MNHIDIGANLTSKRFKSDLNDVIRRASDNNVKHIIVTGTNVDASKKAYELTQEYPSILTSTAGVHPHDAKSWDTKSEHIIRSLLAHKEVVAVGECGLDYNRDFSPREMQRSCFESQLEIATNVNKPVFLHQRDAHDDFFDILKPYRNNIKGAVVHCFTGTLSEAKEYLDLDCFIGITGWLCDSKRGHELREIVKHIPINRLMIETDAPYLTPHGIMPKPKGNRNEPGFLTYVLETLAELVGMEIEALAETLHSNTQRFFEIS